MFVIRVVPPFTKMVTIRVAIRVIYYWGSTGLRVSRLGSRALGLRACGLGFRASGRMALGF